MSDKTLTERDQKTLEFMVKHQQEHGYAPTMREIMAGVGIKTTSHVSYILEKLDALGKIIKYDHVARGYVLNDEEE